MLEFGNAAVPKVLALRRVIVAAVAQRRPLLVARRLRHRTRRWQRGLHQLAFAPRPGAVGVDVGVLSALWRSLGPTNCVHPFGVVEEPWVSGRAWKPDSP